MDLVGARAALHDASMLDETAAATFAPNHSVPAVRTAAPRRPRPVVTALVLFVGAACRPGAEQLASLARDGMRSLWLPRMQQAIEAAQAARLDALVFDASALEGRGGAALARVRAAVQCPVVMLADHGDEVDEIVALELGADAYLLRPVAPRRLRAHLAALARLRQERPLSAAVATLLPAAPDETWRLDRLRNRLCRAATVIELTEMQGAFMQCLLEAQGRIVPRERLIAALPQGQSVHARSVDVYIHRLRKRLQAAGVFGLLIEAIRGRGYVLQQQG
jgi:DNA-binding response OmpR family regulator